MNPLAANILAIPSRIAAMPRTFNGLEVGQYVTFVVPNGIGLKGVEWKQKRAKVVMAFPSHVLCGGSTFGTVVDEGNFVSAGKKPVDKVRALG